MMKQNPFGWTDADERLAVFYNDSGPETDEDAQYTLHARLCNLSGERYVYCEPIATGGVKRIDRMYDPRADRQVAMARLINSDPIHYDAFLREACLTARLEHPNIISIYEIGLTRQNEPYFTMELKSGDSLADVLNKISTGDRAYIQRYPLSTLLEIFLKVCDAVAYAHSKSTVHLDLKPSNVQIGNFGEVKVCDWGLSHIIDLQPVSADEHRIHFDLLNSPPNSNMICGTPGFMAPEQFECAGSVDFRTDIHALGAILYAIINLREPYSGSADEIRQQTLAGQLPAQSAVAPVGLRAAVSKAMARRPDDRYATVGLLSTDIRCFLGDFPTTAESANIGRRLRLFYKRNRRICLIVSSGAAILLLMAAVFDAVLYERARRVQEAQRVAGISEQRYKREKEHVQNVEIDSSGDILFLVKLFSQFNYTAPYDEVIYNQMLAYLDAASARNPADPQLKVGQSITLFIMQRFNQSAAVLKDAPDWAVVVRETALKYGRLKPDDERLTVGQLTDLIREMSRKSPRPATVELIEKMAAFDLERRRSLPERARIVKAVLESANPDWEERVFEYTPQTRSLILGGKGLTMVAQSSFTDRPFMSHPTLLQWLPLRSLELRNVSFALLDQLRDERIVRLDLRNVYGAFNSGVFSRMEFLDELVLPENKLDAGQLARIPSRIHVVTVPMNASSKPE